MGFVTGRLPRLTLALGLALAPVGGAPPVPPPPPAASVRLLVWDLNVCDQFGQGNADCVVTPTQRASAIARSIAAGPRSPDVVTLQEMCRSTFEMVVATLPPSWVSRFHSTYTTTDSRCQSVDHTWGIAVLARGGVLRGHSSYTLGVEPSGERRTLLCIDTEVTVPLRACTTHLTSRSQATAAAQAAAAADLVDGWITGEDTVVVGGDVNLDVRQCGNVDVRNGLRPWYLGPFGAGAVRCYPGSGSMYEVDRYRPHGDGVYDETTLGSAKLDVVFGDRRHVDADTDGDATSSSISDHDPLRGAMTAHGRGRPVAAPPSDVTPTGPAAASSARPGPRGSRTSSAHPPLTTDRPRRSRAPPGMVPRATALRCLVSPKVTADLPVVTPRTRTAGLRQPRRVGAGVGAHFARGRRRRTWTGHRLSPRLVPRPAVRGGTRVELGIDLGTANTVVSDVRRGIVFDEPSVMLLRQGGARRERVLAVGRDAADLLGRAPSRFVAVRPLHDGVVTDLETARVYLRSVLQRAGRRAWAPVRAVIAVPVGSTPLEHRALLEAAEEAGIRPVTALDEAIAGAVGCGVDPLERRVHMVVDVGGGTAEAVAFCFGGVLAHRTSKLGGDEMTLAVARYLREEHQLHIGELEAEALKIRAAADGNDPLVVQGRDAATGRPRLATVRGGEVTDALRPITDEIVRTLVACLDDLPPQAFADVLAEGVLVFGGSSLASGFPQELERGLGLPVKLAEDPLTCVAEGAARALRNRALLAAYGRG